MGDRPHQQLSLAKAREARRVIVVLHLRAKERVAPSTVARLAKDPKSRELPIRKVATNFPPAVSNNESIMIPPPSHLRGIMKSNTKNPDASLVFKPSTLEKEKE